MIISGGFSMMSFTLHNADKNEMMTAAFDDSSQIGKPSSMTPANSYLR